jgi:hypothetical protein
MSKKVDIFNVRLSIRRKEVASLDCPKQTEDLSFEYKYGILSDKTLNCAVEYVHTLYIRSASKQECMRRIEQWLTVSLVITLGDECKSDCSDNTVVDGGKCGCI